MTHVRVLGALDPLFAWDGRALLDAAALRGPAGPTPELRGSAGCVLGDGHGGWRLLRDPLGLAKLFWAAEDDGTVAVAARPARLVEAGHPFARIRALPRGIVVDLPAAGPVAQRALDAPGADGAETGVEATAAAVVRSLDAYLAALAAADPRRRAVVCLSGGLDSSLIAVLAREHFADVLGVSFDLERPGGGPSEDRVVARRLARDLGLGLLEVTVSGRALLELLDVVLVEGVDWRDFNVHAGLVNGALAQAIAAEVGAGALVLTGDLANELLVDYHPERHAGAEHYALPDLPPAVLRRSLVRGLDTTHREIGVFGAWNLPLVQPYAVAVDAFLALSPSVLTRPDAKQRLAYAAVGDRLPAYVLERPKTRAQIGGEGSEGGVLAVCVDAGIDAARLRERFAVLHGVDDPAALDRFVRSGMYRAAVPPSAEVAHAGS